MVSSLGGGAPPPGSRVVVVGVDVTGESDSGQTSVDLGKTLCVFQTVLTRGSVIQYFAVGQRRDLKRP